MDLVLVGVDDDFSLDCCVVGFVCVFFLGDLGVSFGLLGVDVLIGDEVGYEGICG